MMQTPVFLDHLPDLGDMHIRKSTLYRLHQGRALLDLALDETVTWHIRETCPACATPQTQSQSFCQSHIAFRRCGTCKSIYAAQVPSQHRLDRLRLVGRPAGPGPVSDSASIEYVSLLNWISLAEVRYGVDLSSVLDVRFSSQSPGWRQAVQDLSRNRAWQFLPLNALPDGAPAFDDLACVLSDMRPRAVLIPAEMDRAADPGALLRVIHREAAPGTLVFVASSCADGLEYELLGADSPSFVPLDRLTLFSVKGFQTLAETIGFTPLEVSTPGRFDAVILAQYFRASQTAHIPFWSDFFREANKARLHDLQLLLQRSLRSGVMRFVLQT